jgi:hypothetical protein
MDNQTAVTKANEALSRGCLFMYRVIEEDFDILVKRQDLHVGQLAETQDMYVDERVALKRAQFLSEQKGKRIMRTYP